LRFEYNSEDPVVINQELIRFNGVEDDGHETFFVERNNTSGFNFCKTACKPYDVAVGCCLIVMQNENPKNFVVSSDGDKQDWQEIIQLYEKLFGEKPSLEFLERDDD